MGVLKVLGLGVGDVLGSMLAWAALFGALTIVAGVVTLVWARGRMRSAGRSTTLGTVLIMLLLTMILPVGGCGLGAKYGIEHSLARMVEKGSAAIGKGIVQDLDPKVRKELGVPSETTVIQVAPTRERILALLKGRTFGEHLTGVLKSTYLGALDAASYTFLSSEIPWSDLRDRAHTMLSTPSSALLDPLLGIFAHAAHATLLTALFVVLLANAIAWLIVLVSCRSPRGERQ
jgi:hypothetical protein